MSYQSRARLIERVRWIPGPVRDMGLSVVNPLRVKLAQQYKPVKWMTLFITNYCNARCQHCFYWNELNKKKTELNLDELTRTFASLRNQL
ncbi:MAG: hypothetical protein VYE04_09435, partial [Pseudomonadota bacterium]|nr:hypothetical protein [Pseudomonadota bacterium]